MIKRTKGELSPSVGLMFRFHLSPPEGSAILAAVGAVATNQYSEPTVHYFGVGKNCIGLCSLDGPTQVFKSNWLRMSLQEPLQ